MIEKMNKVITTVDIDVDSNMDADDYGHRITECFNKLIKDNDVVNVIKVHLDSKVKASDIEYLLSNLHSLFIELNVHNFVIVPIGVCGINDISIEYVKSK